MSDHKCTGHNYVDIVSSSPPIEQVALSDISPQDKPWDKHRKNAEIISSYYKKGGMERYAKRVDLCSRNLDFRLVDDQYRGQKKLKLFKAQFCRVRHCPIFIQH